MIKSLRHFIWVRERERERVTRMHSGILLVTWWYTLPETISAPEHYWVDGVFLLGWPISRAFAVPSFCLLPISSFKLCVCLVFWCFHKWPFYGLSSSDLQQEIRSSRLELAGSGDTQFFFSVYPDKVGPVTSYKCGYKTYKLGWNPTYAAQMAGVRYKPSNSYETFAHHFFMWKHPGKPSHGVSWNLSAAFCPKKIQVQSTA